MVFLVWDLRGLRKGRGGADVGTVVAVGGGEGRRVGACDGLGIDGGGLLLVFVMVWSW